MREGFPSQNVTAFACTSHAFWLEQIEAWLKSGVMLFDLNAWPLDGPAPT